MDNLKPALTYKEQVDRLIKKGVVVKNRKRCYYFLHRVNYYRFLAYLLTFRNPDGETYKNVPFEKAESIYYFDKSLRSLILSFIDEIEIQLRAALAYYHGHKYGPGGYESEDAFNKFHDHKAFWNHIEHCIEDNANSPIVKHHKAKYEGRFPIWVIIEFFSIGELSYFYRGMKYNDRTAISNYLYQVDEKTLKSWFRCLTDLRNRCAHCSRLYYWIFPAIPKLPNDSGVKIDRRLFCQLYMLKLMYPNKAKWNNSFIKCLERLLGHHKEDVLLSCIGFPTNWKELLTK